MLRNTEHNTHHAPRTTGSQGQDGNHYGLGRAVVGSWATWKGYTRLRVSAEPRSLQWLHELDIKQLTVQKAICDRRLLVVVACVVPRTRITGTASGYRRSPVFSFLLGDMRPTVWRARS